MAVKGGIRTLAGRLRVLGEKVEQVSKLLFRVTGPNRVKPNRCNQKHSEDCDGHRLVTGCDLRSPAVRDKPNGNESEEQIPDNVEGIDPSRRSISQV